MKVLSWDKPKKVISTEEWSSISADSAPPGVYTPNMSKEDKLKWKAKKIGGENPRVEIRKSLSFHGVNLVIIMWSDKEVQLSANGTMTFSEQEFKEFMQAIEEAKEVLESAN